MWRAVAFLLAAAPAHAEGRDALYGLWGDARQCARQPIVAGATLRAEPFEIGPGWLRHGAIWCRLTWFPAEPRGDGLYVSTRALCGEDSAQSYRLDFALAGGTLTMIWDESVANGPLQRCANRK